MTTTTLERPPGVGVIDPVRRPHQALYRPGEVATFFGVDPKTVSRWARTGRVDSIRTAGGHYRITAAGMAKLLAPVA